MFRKWIHTHNPLRKARKGWRRLFLRLGIAVLSLTSLFFLLNLLFPLPDRVSYSTMITDNRNQLIHAYLTPDQQWRMKTELNEISPLLQKTIIAKEDKYFYYHPGVNPLALGRAVVNNLLRRRRTSGASTITMQVARMLEPKRRTYWNKLVEIFRAFQLELRYSKREILQLYLNLVPYGGNIQGVKAASLIYFNKNPDHLSLAEITALSVIPNQPSSLVIGKTNERIVAVRNRWLKKFAEEDVFTKKEIADALAEPLTAYRHPVPRMVPHLALKLRLSGGTLVHSTIDLNMQLKAEKLVQDYVRALRLRNIHNAAVIILDNQSHEVLSYVGSADFFDTTDAGQVNGAAAIRQPGSTLKPLLYGLSIDKGLLTPHAVITDVPVSYQGYAPENYDRQFNGYVSMEYALEHSLNIPAVKTLKQLGTEPLINVLAECRFRQVAADQRKLGLSMILGGCGATLEELSGLYSIFANEGRFSPPVYIVPDSNAKQKSVPSKEILSPAATFMINDILSKVNRPDFPLNWQSTEHMPKIAWKTGTSYGRRDAWSIGYNRHFTVGVWVGNFSAVGVPELSGANIATPLLFRIFNTIDYDSDLGWFRRPADCDFRQVCPETGLLPGPNCQHLVSDYFIPLVSTMKRCDNQEEVMISADGKISYCASCAPGTGYVKKWYTKISPDMQHYFEERHIVYQKIPPHNPECERIFKNGAPLILSPQQGAEYILNRKKPEPLQLRCTVGNDVQIVYWYINNRFLKSANAHDRPFFVPEEGPVKISCTDDKGRNRDVWIRVKKADF